MWAACVGYGVFGDLPTDKRRHPLGGTPCKGVNNAARRVKPDTPRSTVACHTYTRLTSEWESLTEVWAGSDHREVQAAAGRLLGL